MSENIDNWDTHALNPYVSEYVIPFRERKSGKEYTYEDVCQETFALVLWKLQEEYHMDFRTAYLLSNQWRVISNGRLRRMFGKEAIDDWELNGGYWDDHPEVLEMEKDLPKRNVGIIRPISQDLTWGEWSIYD